MSIWPSLLALLAPWGGITSGLCWLSVLLLMLLSGCRITTKAPQPRALQVQQTWELQPGSQVAGYPVVAGLGDISIHLQGQPARAPFAGEVEPLAQERCVVFSSAEVPAYLFRLCGLNRPRLGRVKAGQKIGSGQYLHVATLRRQPDGTWVMVEPANSILERILQPQP